MKIIEKGKPEFDPREAQEVRYLKEGNLTTFGYLFTEEYAIAQYSEIDLVSHEERNEYKIIEGEKEVSAFMESLPMVLDQKPEPAKMTVAMDRNNRLDFARKYGYKYATYTFSIYQNEIETRPPGSPYSLHLDDSEIEDGYRCDLIEVKTGRIIVIGKGDGPLAAKQAAMAAYADKILGDTISHNLGQSAEEGVRFLTLAQAAALDLPMLSDYKPKELGQGLKKWLKDKGVSQAQAAKLCSVTLRTFQRWIAGRPPIPKGMWELLSAKVKP